MMARYLRLPYGSKLVKVRRHNNEFIPHQDTVFWSGDELFFTADSGFVSEVKKQLDKIN